MRYIFIFALFLYFSSSQNPVPNRAESSKQQQQQTKTTQQQTSTDQHGTEDSPFVIKILPSSKTQDETTQEAKDRQEKSSSDRNLVIATYVLAAIGALQLLVFGYQAIQLRKTVEAAGLQSSDMQRSIDEANRSATAMELVAKHVEISSKAAIDSVGALRERTAQQMRAYLTVNTGPAIYQEREKSLKFEARPILMNTGHTPAHKVSYVAGADILPMTLPDNFAFPLPDKFIGASVLAAQQQNQLFAVVNSFVEDSEIGDVKSGKGRALYVWGIVRYEDIFGESHTTKFCQFITWLPDGNVFGIFIPKHNEAT